MNRTTQLASLSTLLLAAACGSADDGTGTDDTEVVDPNDPMMMVPDDPMMMVPDDPADPPESEYAPGIADPCVNALDTNYPNDEICLEPPPPEMGIQIYYGPGPNVDYDDPDAIRPFIIEPGTQASDVVQCQYRTLANEQLQYVSEYHTRARQGTHHVIFWTAQGEGAPLEADGTLTPECRGTMFSGYGFVPGTQSGFGEEGARLDVPIDDVEVPENQGYARQLVARANVAIETHYLNTSPEPMLAEVWANFIYKDPATVQHVIYPMFLIGGLDTQVYIGQEQTVGRDNLVPPHGETGEIRMMGFGAHAHAHTRRATAWINRAATGQREYVYETYNWSEPLTPMFDSGHEYPPVELGSGNDGAHSGVLTMGPGDSFGWECHIQNDNVQDSDPSAPGDQPITFGDGAYVLEMCNMFGFFAHGTGQWNSLY